MLKQIVSMLVGVAASVVFGAGPVWPQTTSNPETGQTKMEGAAKRTPEAKKGEVEMEVRGAQKPGRMGRSGAAGTDKQNVSEKSAAEDVRKAQEALKNKGHDPGNIDGIMGPQTRQAIRAFQSTNGLKETGRLDKETASKLDVSGK